MLVKEERIETDLLIIGGGLSGAFAAIKAREAGCEKVMVVSKGMLGKDSISSFAAGAFTMIFPEDGRGELIRLWGLSEAYGAGIYDEEWLNIWLEENYERILEMERWGVEWEKTPGGKFERKIGRFAKVSELDIPVVVHPTVRIPVWGGVKHNMSGSVSREYDIIKAFVEALSGVLPEFPDVKFLFSHYAGGVPFLLPRIKSWYVPSGRSPIPEERRAAPKTMREFADYGLEKDFDKLLDQFYYNMAGTGGSMTALKQALMVLKPERICFGSDYPWEMARPSDLKAYINGVKRLDIPERDKVNILGGNVLRLFKG